MSKDEEIPVEEDVIDEESENGEEKLWTDELKVTGEELVDTVKKLVSEVGVRRIVVRSGQGRVLVEIPLLLGLGGIALLPTYAALALFAALVADYSILVEREEKAEETASEAE